MTCMSQGRSLFRISDKDASRGCHDVLNFTHAETWNKQEWGLFWTVNRFNGPRRKEHCEQVLAWAVDLDSGTKLTQLKKIKQGPIIPSAVIETARGHHAYFNAKEGDPENYRDIVERLVEFYDGDKNAKDVCRILRVPGFLHWKGETPFAIKALFFSECAYTEQEMRNAFPVKEPEEKIFEQKTELRRELKNLGEGSIWEKIWNLDCEHALNRLSGHPAVNCESFSFKRTTGGNLNIFVNGKGTSCWIDRNKRIGSLDGGGPSIFQWIKWYTRDNKRTVEVIKTVFPEVSKC